MFDKIKQSVPAPIIPLLGWIVTALVLVFFWVPVWTFIIQIATSARDLLHK